MTSGGGRPPITAGDRERVRPPRRLVVVVRAAPGTEAAEAGRPVLMATGIISVAFLCSFSEIQNGSNFRFGVTQRIRGIGVCRRIFLCFPSVKKTMLSPEVQADRSKRCPFCSRAFLEQIRLFVSRFTNRKLQSLDCSEIRLVVDQIRETRMNSQSASFQVVLLFRVKPLFVLMRADQQIFPRTFSRPLEPMAFVERTTVDALTQEG